MAAKRTLMVFCTLYGLAKVVGTVLYHLRGAGQLQLAVLIVSLVVGVIGLGAGIIWIAQRRVRGDGTNLAAAVQHGGGCQYSDYPRQSGAAGHRSMGDSGDRHIV